MTPEDIAQHEAAWAEVHEILFTQNHNLTALQAKAKAERVIRPLGASNIAYLMGQAVDLMPKDRRGAEAKMDLARDQIKQFKQND